MSTLRPKNPDRTNPDGSSFDSASVHCTSEAQLAAIVLGYDAALADGGELPAFDESSVAPEWGQRLRQARACLEALERVWPRGLRDETPLNRKTLELPRLEDTVTGGHRFGRFQILRELGRGGCGIVYLALDRMLRREVVLKVLRPELLSNAEMRKRFLREAQAAAAIEHDHIVTIYQVGEEQGVPFLAMQYLRGETLEERVRREGSLPPPEVLRIGREIATGLGAAHRRGLIHRDIKPANIWLEEKESPYGGMDTTASRVKILDFGMVHTEDGSPALTMTGAMLGTPAYMAPEQARGSGMDHRGDQFSLGCVLYRLSTGQYPFRGTNSFTVLESIVSHAPPSPRELKREIPHALSDLVMKLLAKQPEARFATMTEVLAALEACTALHPPPPGAGKLPSAAPAAHRDATPQHDLPSHLPQAPPPPLRLVLYQPGQPIQSWPLIPGDTCLIGRGALAKLQVDDPFCSRMHCQIEARGSRWVLSDVGSSSGTRVNGERVKRCLLHVGDEIEIGKTRLNVVARAEPSECSTELDDPPVCLDEFVGRSIDRFIAVDVLARGVHGHVFLAMDVEQNRDVAIKVLFPTHGQDDRHRRQFIRAVQTMQSVQHANLVELYLAGRVGPYCWLAMEFVPGENLAQVIARSATEGLLDWKKSLRIALQVARALECLTRHDVIHRNISPKKILVRTGDNVVKLGGLMLAKSWVDSAADVSPADMPLGELAYGSPERVSGSGPIDGRTAIYELGATVYGLLTGRPPFAGGSLDTLLCNIQSSEPMRPTVFQPAMNELFEAAVLRMIARHPEERYQSAAELVGDLERIGGSLGMLLG